jgi:hypothetical protein
MRLTLRFTLFSDDKRKRGSESVETVYPMAKKRRLRNADD